MKNMSTRPTNAIRKQNSRRLKTCFNLGTTDKVKRVQAMGFNLVNTASAQICGGLEGLEIEYQTDTIVEKVTIASNDKLGKIPAISSPNIFEQSTVMQLVKMNPELEEKYEVVRILMDYFREHKVCLNCENCSGLCYNNKYAYMKPGKAISDLRTLVAYITNPSALAERIRKETKFSTVFRINANGEIHSKEMLNFWLTIMKKQPRTRFFTYTKSYELFEEYLQENTLPSNFILNMSIMEGQEQGLIEKFPKLAECNKFIATTTIPLNTRKVCIADCTECELCYTNHRKTSNTIYVRYHN